MPQTQQIEIPGVGVVEFPDSMSDVDVTAAVKKLHDQATAAALPMPSPHSSQTPAVLLGTAAAASAAPLAQRALEHLATSPTAAQTGGAIARGATTLAALGRGLYSGDMSQVLAAPTEGWVAGKGGYWLTQGLQKVAAPIATALEKAGPVLKQAGPLLGSLTAEGSANEQLNTPEHLAAFAAHLSPAQQAKFDTLLKSTSGANADQDIAAVKKLIADGAPPSAAVKHVAGDNPTRFGSLMTLYLRSRQVK